MNKSSVPHQTVQANRPTNDVQLLLRHGMSAGRAGDRVEARRRFQAVLDADPDNTTALLWLGWLAPTKRESLTLFSRVLELDPKNERARAGIRWARRRPSDTLDAPGSGSPSAPTSVHPERADFLRAASHSTKTEKNARSGAAAHRARRPIRPLGLFLVIAACLFVAGAALVARFSPTVVQAWLPSGTPTAVPLLISASTPTPSPTSATSTPIPTATHTPSPMPTPTATNTPSPSPTPTLPPTPTATPIPPSASPPVAGDEKWIDVDLTHQQLTAYEGSSPVFQAAVSTGLPNTPTMVGEFRVYLKLTATAMAGPGYYLPGVPYTMYFYGGYALHGTYWHNNFGNPMSHGCVNLSTEDARRLFEWADPILPSGASQVRASNSNPGTLVVVHH